VADDEYTGGVRRQNGRLGGAAAPRWEAKATALLHSAEPHRSCARQRESTLANMHPDVISQTNKINEGNKCNLAESKTDLVGMHLRKKQRDFGRYEAMKYFMQDDVKRLSWSAPIFNDGKVDSKDGAIADGGIFVSLSKCL